MQDEKAIQEPRLVRQLQQLQEINTALSHQKNRLESVVNRFVHPNELRKDSIPTEKPQERTTFVGHLDKLIIDGDNNLSEIRILIDRLVELAGE